MVFNRTYLRALASALTLCALLVSRFQPFYITLLVGPKDDWRRSLQKIGFRQVPRLEPFAYGVLDRVPPGSTVALALPYRDWNAYSYCYYRVSYVLAGRSVLPLLDPDSRPHPENIGRSGYLAAWRTKPPAEGTELWRGWDGVLLRRSAP